MSGASDGKALLNCPAPAKLNLFLHITGRRSDGYHLLETVFQLIDLCDSLSFYPRSDGEIHRTTASFVPEEDDLSVRAARLLAGEFFARTGKPVPGADIALLKRIPAGGGLGGGSSDAATSLMALNRLWNSKFSRAELSAMALRLGADVPFFLSGGNAFAKGIGEVLFPVNTPPAWFVVVIPPVSVPTASVFRAAKLTSYAIPIKIIDFPDIYQKLGSFGNNGLEKAAVRLFPEIGEALKDLSRFGPARMTGSGGCVFAAFPDRASAENAAAALRPKWNTLAVRGIQQHPFRRLPDESREKGLI